MIFTDGIGSKVEIPSAPKRVISLVPSLTELLYDLGLGERLIGRTKFCIYPKGKLQEVENIGGTKNPHIEKIKALNPDLVIANKEENNLQDVTALQEFVPVYTTQIKTIDEAITAISQLGLALNLDNQAKKLTTIIGYQLAQMESFQSIRVAYLIWENPYMTVGGDTYISHILEKVGLINVFRDELRYPIKELKDIASAGAEAVLLSTEPFPFTEEHASNLEQEISIPVITVDGAMCSWYGSRIPKAIPYLLSYRLHLKERILQVE